MELVESGDSWTIEVGTEMTFALPALRERVTGIDPLPPQAPASAGNGRPSDLELARRAAAQERALADELHEQLQATSARADRLAVELEKAHAEADARAAAARAEADARAAAADAERAQVFEELEGTRRLVTTQESDLDSLRRDAEAAGQARAAAEADAANARERVAEGLTWIRGLMSKTEEARARNGELSATLAEMTDEVARLERERTDSQSRASTAIGGREALQIRLQAAEDAASAATLDADQSRLRSDEAAARADEAAHGLATWRQKAELLRSNLEEAEERASNLTAEGRGREDDLARTREDAERRIRALAEEQEQLSERLEAAETQAASEREAQEACRAGEETQAELARVSAAHETALARNREVEGLLLVTQWRARELDVDCELVVGMEPERIKDLEREAEEARRAGREAQAELARVSAAHETALARNREVEGLLLVADRRARQLEVGWELEVQARLVVTRRVAATREAARLREAAERRLAERQAGARKSAQRIKDLDRALALALIEERERVEELERKAEQADRAGEEAQPELARQSGGDPVRRPEAAPQRA